jgi:hypothetical protein
MMHLLQHLRALAASRAALAPAAGVAAFPAASLAAAPASAAARGLRVSATRMGIGSHVSDNDPAVLELEKRRNLSKGALPGGGGVPDVEGWNEALASDSEAVVRPPRARAACKRLAEALRPGTGLQCRFVSAARPPPGAAPGWRYRRFAWRSGPSLLRLSLRFAEFGR